MEFMRTQVDGVPTFWIASGHELLAGLVFRVGCADESLARAGITHLIEHLALYPLGVDARLHYNGRVDSLTTTFVIRGSAEKIVDFFGAVCGSLRRLPVGRLDKETQVLRSEADGRRPARSEPLLRRRYGAETYGLAAFPEFGIGAISPAELTMWAARWFTRGNAALWMAGGSPPAGLKLDLPDGAAVPPPDPADRLPATPAYFTAATQLVGCCGLITRSAAAQVYCGVLQSRLSRELRYEQALSYSPVAAYTIRDHQFAHVLAFADGLPESHSTLVPAFVRELERLESAPVTDDELGSVTESLRAAADTPAGAAQRVGRAARNEIMGRPTDSVARWKEKVCAVTAADIQDAAREVLASSLLVLPRGRELHRARFTWAPALSESIVAGRRFRSADYPFDRSQLVIGSGGVSLISGQATATVRYADCAALLKWSDGARHVIGRDGIGVHLEPALWQLTQDAIGQIDAGVDGDRVVSMPYRDPDQRPRPWTRRRTRVLATLVRHPVAAVLFGVVPVAVVLVTLARIAPGAAGIGGAILVPCMVAGIAAIRIVRARLWLTAAKQAQARSASGRYG